MYKLIATIKNIQNNQNLNIVTFAFGEKILKMMSLDLNSDIDIGSKVSLNIKPTSVALAKNFSGDVSYANQINVDVLEVEYGELLCNVQLSCGESIFESIITKESAQRMNIQIGESLIALIKANEISIAEVLD